jgi:hypothetical protein
VAIFLVHHGVDRNRSFHLTSIFCNSFEKWGKPRISPISRIFREITDQEQKHHSIGEIRVIRGQSLQTAKALPFSVGELCADRLSQAAGQLATLPGPDAPRVVVATRAGLEQIVNEHVRRSECPPDWARPRLARPARE